MSNLKKKRSEDGFNLSFLDVMACGLGAVLMILILVKFNEPAPVVDISELQKKLEELKERNDQSQDRIEQLSEEKAKNEAQSEKARAQIQVKNSALKQAENQRLEVLDKIIGQIDAPPKPKPTPTPAPPPPPKVAEDEDIFKETPGQNQDYLLGMKVQGQRIVILLDTSGSMAAEDVAQATLASLDSSEKRAQTKKWQRAVRTAKWLFNGAPKNAQIAVIAFNEQTRVLGGSGSLRANRDDADRLSASLNSLSPQGGTNLAAGLAKASEVMPNLTHLYLITDGLPTIGQSRSSACRGNTVSGACRIEFFQNASANFSRQSGAEVNVVLLPFDGEIDAPNEYWKWAESKRGTFLYPAGQWP